jgi:predicted nucleic acid-binding protein
MIRALFDTNVLLDIALARPEFAAPSMAAYEGAVSAGCSALIAPHSLATFYYLIRQSHGNKRALAAVADLLMTGEMATFDKDSAAVALELGFSDFEDAMIASCAQSAGAECIVTRNVSDFRNSPITACSPEAFLERISDGRRS